MAEDDKLTGKGISVRVEQTPTTVTFGRAPTIDLSGIPEAERSKMLAAYTNKVLDISAMAQKMSVDVDALRATLGSLAMTTNEAAEAGNAITITHTQDTSIGRTEIIMGNTDQAKIGKLSRSQSGEKDWTPYYIGAGLIALVLIAAIMGGA